MNYNDPTGPATGQETGWWDEDGRPAPWPDDFFLDDGTINPDWQPAGRRSPTDRPDPEPF